MIFGKFGGKEGTEIQKKSNSLRLTWAGKLFNRNVMYGSSQSCIMWKYIVIVSIFGVCLLRNHQICGQIFGYEPNVDYPAYERIPSGLTFRCSDRMPGYYADVETRCQIWHWCLPNGYMFSFLCPNGTVFNQAVRVCDWWTNVNCGDSEGLYDNNNELYRDIEGNLIAG